MRRFAFAMVLTLVAAPFCAAQETLPAPDNLADEANVAQEDIGARAGRPRIQLDLRADPVDGQQASPSDRYAPPSLKPPRPTPSSGRHNDAREAVRRKAEIKAAHRRARLESHRWNGYSPLRPATSPLPQMGYAGPSVHGAFWAPYTRWLSPLPYTSNAPQVQYHR